MALPLSSGSAASRSTPAEDAIPIATDRQTSRATPSPQRLPLGLHVRNTFLETFDDDFDPEDDITGDFVSRRRKTLSRSGSDPLLSTPARRVLDALLDEERRPEPSPAGHVAARPGGEFASAPLEGEEQIHTLRVEAVSAEQKAEALLGRHACVEAELAAWHAAGHDASTASLHSEERELREKLYAVEQDLEDTREAQAAAGVRREGVTVSLRQELEAEVSESACDEQEIAALKQELGMERHKHAEASEQYKPASQGHPSSRSAQRSGDSVPCEHTKVEAVPSSATVSAQRAQTAALLELSEARHAAAAVFNDRDKALTTLRSTRRAPPGSKQRTVLEHETIETLERRKEVLHRATMWRDICGSTSSRADACQEKVLRAQARAEDLEGKETDAASRVEGLKPELDRATKAKECAALDVLRLQHNQRMACAFLIFALALVVAKALKLWV